MSSKVKIFRLNKKTIKHKVISYFIMLSVAYALGNSVLQMTWPLRLHLVFAHLMLAYLFYLLIYLKERERKRKKESRRDEELLWARLWTSLNTNSVFYKLKVHREDLCKQKIMKVLSPVVTRFGAKGVEKWDYLLCPDNRRFTQKMTLNRAFNDEMVVYKICRWYTQETK